MKNALARPAMWLNLALLLALTLTLPAPVLGLAADRTHVFVQTEDAVRAPEGSERQAGSAPTADGIDCTKPLPGRTTTLGVDDEILIALENSIGEMGIAKYDNTSDTDASLKYFWQSKISNDTWWRPRSAAITAADLDLDGKVEVVMAIGDDNPGELEVISIKNPEASSGDLARDFWSSSSNYRQGENMGYLMATAAGDLDATHGGNASEEVVVAFGDDQQYLQVVLLDGESDGGIQYMGTWRSSSHDRYEMTDIAAAVGDLDGDGYKDEIALALSDQYEVLQIIVLEYNGSGGLTELAYGRYSGASEVDVTTGVFSGDGRDQIAAVYKDSEKNLHVGLFQFNSSDNSLHSLSWWHSSDQYRDDVEYVSIASGDIDGDRWDEVVTAFADQNDYFQAVTLDADTGQLKFHSSNWGVDAATDVDYVSVDAGDIDGDGKAEIVASFSDYDDLLQILSFDDNSACPCSDNGDGLHLRDQRQDMDTRFTDLVMGDVDGNNLYGDYTGKCQQLDETRLISMVNRPPYWEAYNPETDVAYASSIKGGDVTADQITNSYGSSATFESEFEFGKFKLGSSFTKSWEHSITQTTEHGSSLETRAGWTSPDDGLVTLNTVTYYAYQYQKRDGSGLARVSVPVSTQTDSKKMSYWNASGGAQTLFPDSWVPAHRTGWMDKQLVYSTEDSDKWAGSDFGQINGQTERVSAWSDGAKYIYYEVDSWATYFGGPETGDKPGGLGIALTELNGNGKPELIVAWVEDPAGDNNAYYSVGWDIPANPTNWSAKKQIPGWVGGSTQGAALDIHDVNGNGRPEIFFGWIDNPAGTNHGYYRVGWDLDTNGDSSNWWPNPRPIEGNFGDGNGGMGLTIADSDGDGDLDLVAAWGREAEEAGQWELGYSIGQDLQGSSFVESWAPGHPIPVPPEHKVVGATVASADLVAADGHPELVVGWIEDQVGGNPAYTRVGTCQQLGGEVDQRPTDIEDPVAKDGQFKIKLHDQWWDTNGDLLWRWDKSGGPPPPIYISLGGGDPYWKVEKTTFTEQTVETSESYNYEVSGEAEFLGIGAQGSKTWGFEEGTSYSISWEQGFFMDGTNVGLDPYKQPPPTQAQEYKYNPFTYMQESDSHTGVKQAYMVLDYFVPWRGSDTGQNTSTEAARATGPAVAPGIPLIDSITHPDPGAWYAADTATFTWRQPDGDPAVVDGYRWYMDRNPDTVPREMSLGLATTDTYEGLSDGLWYVHLRARSDGGKWGETAHLAVLVDTHAPQVALSLDPARPTEGSGWYNVPVRAEVSADDGDGSGTTRIETSTDGATWQPYTQPLIFDTDMASTTLWARATDLMDHVSEPVSKTFALDLTLPTTQVAPGCWKPGRDCMAGVITDAAGNQRLRLSGQINGSVSGERGLGIQINGERWTAADEIGNGLWSYTSDTDLGAGCYAFHVQGEDWAGNMETLRAHGEEVAWHPRQRPELSGSRIAVVPNKARPGETVAVTLNVPNSGPQDTLVPISATVPAGLQVQADSISSDGVYDDASRTITWPPRLLWPGQERPLSFGAQVDGGLAATTLDISLTALGTWPIVDTCPASELAAFRDTETTVQRTAQLSVDPALPDGADTQPPASPSLRIEAGPATNHRQTQLLITKDGSAVTDARWMFLREWTLDTSDGTWTAVQESGWLPYSPTVPWSLSQGDGAKYMGVWLADAEGNVTVLDFKSLALTNLLEGSQTLTDGQRIQYRFPLRIRDLAIFGLEARSGDPNLYIWQPANGWRPDFAADGTGPVETVGFPVSRRGLHLVEVQANGDSRYALHLAGDVDPKSAASLSEMAEGTPEHPITLSDPLSAGVAVAPGPPEMPKLYLPLAYKNR